MLTEARWLLDLGLLPNTSSATRAIGYRQVKTLYFLYLIVKNVFLDEFIISFVFRQWNIYQNAVDKEV